MSFEFYQQGTPTGYTEEMSYRADVEAQITAIESDITTINGNITALEQMTGSVDLSGLTTVDKTSLVGAINETVTNIETNAGNIATNVTNINNNATNITKNTNDIKDIATVNASNFESLQAAHDYITANYNFGVLLIPEDIILTDTFTWDVRKVSLKGYGATLKFNFTDLNKYAVQTISSETTEPYNQSTTLVQGVKFRSYDIAQKCNGFKFYSTDMYKAIAHVNFRNCEISGFNKGLDFKERSYAITFDNCDIYRNVDAIYMGGTLDDCGERISFKDCTIYNNFNAITNTNPNGGMHFTNCSIDYNTNKIAEVGTGRLFFFNCHIEHRATYFTASNRPFIASGNGGTILIIGGILMFTSYADTTMDYIFQNSTSGKGGVFLNEVFMLGCMTTTNYLATGTGFTSVVRTKGGSVEENAVIIAPEMSTMKDGGFEATSLQDEIFIVSDTTTITSRTMTGTNIALSLDSTQYRSGTKSLKVNKVGGSGSNATFTIMIPITKGCLPGWELYYKKVGSQTGTMNYSYGFCKKALDDIQYKKLSIGSANVTFTSATVDWTRIKNNTDRQRTPMWATHLYIDINLFSMYAGDLFFDDITVTEM